MTEYIDNAITLDTIIDGNEKKLRDLANENRETAKSYVFDNIRNGLLPDDETLKELNITRNIGESKFSHIVMDRYIVKDNKVYQKDSVKQVASLIKELNTIEKSADKFVTEE